MSDYQLREYDEEEPLTANERNVAKNFFIAATRAAWDNLSGDVEFQDDSGQPISVGGIRDWAAEFAGSSKYGDIVKKWDDLAGSLSEDKIRELYDGQTTASAAAEIWITALLVEIQQTIDPEAAPAGTDISSAVIEDQVSEDPDQEAINANARRNDAAELEKAKQAALIKADSEKLDAVLKIAFSIPARIMEGKFEPVISLKTSSWRTSDPGLEVSRSLAKIPSGNRFSE